MVRAIFSSDLSEVSRVLEDDPDECHLLDGDKRGALHAAAFVGDADVVEAVITQGNAKVNSKDNQWLTPLHRACRASADVSADDEIEVY